MTIAVTGATGFVGSTVLAQLGARATGITRDAWASREALERALRGATAIVHAASVVHRPGASASEYEDFNTRGTSLLIEAARAVGAKQIVFLSSIKVYGEEPVGDIDEQTPIAHESPYAASKAAAERLLLAAGDLSTAILRLCPVYGVGDKGNVRKVAIAIARRRFALPGDGSTRKSIVHVSAVARAVDAVLARPTTDTFVIADPIAPSMRELADAIGRQLHRRVLSVPIPVLMAAAGGFELLAKLRRRPPGVSRELIAKSLRPTVCSPAKFERAYGTSLHVDLDAAIAEELAWLRLR